MTQLRWTGRVQTLGASPEEKGTGTGWLLLGGAGLFVLGFALARYAPQVAPSPPRALPPPVPESGNRKTKGPSWFFVYDKYAEDPNQVNVYKVKAGTSSSAIAKISKKLKRARGIGLRVGPWSQWKEHPGDKMQVVGK